MNERFYSSDPDNIYRMAERCSSAADRLCRDNDFLGAIRVTEKVVDLLQTYRDVVKVYGPDKLDLDIEIAFHDAEINYFTSQFYLSDDRYVLGEREARLSLRKFKQLRSIYISNEHIKNKMAMRIRRLDELIDYAQTSRTDPTNTKGINLLNEMDIASLLGNEEKVERLVKLFEANSTDRKN